MIISLDNPLTALAGGLLVAVICYDFASTLLTVSGAGPVTTRITDLLWRGALRLHRVRPAHRLLAIVGPLLTMVVLLTWLIGVWIGWTLIFSSSIGAIMDSVTRLPASFWQRAYFVGYTLTTLGLGDYAPAGGLWRGLTVVVSANGLFLFTMAITYIVPLVSAAAAKRELAEYIHCLGETPEDILINNWNGRDFDSLLPHLHRLSFLIVQTSQQHANYPILHYFHMPQALRALPVQLAALDEALTLMNCAIEPHCRLPGPGYKPAQKAIAQWIDMRLVSSTYTKGEPPPALTLTTLAQAQLPVVDRFVFETALLSVTDHRRHLGLLIQNDGWDWYAVHHSNTELARNTPA